MKVQSDVFSRLNLQNASIQPVRARGAAVQQRAAVQSGRKDNQDPSLRSVSNVMTIMHKAQSIVQRALTVSTRLQGIAMNSFSSDGPNMNQLQKEIQTINASLGEYDAGVSPPPVEQSIRPEAVRDVLERMNRMVQGGTVDKTEVGAINSSLQKRLNGINNDIAVMENRYGIQPDPDVGKTAGTIRANSSAAIAAQGSVSADTVSQVIE